MKTLFFLLAISLLSGCQSASESPLNPSTDTEVFDASAPTSGTLIKTMIVQSTVRDTYYEGPRYEYHYGYDASNRLVKLDFWGYIHKDTRDQALILANYLHRVATLDYNDLGELTALHMTSYDRQGKRLPYDLSFPVKKEGEAFAIYGQKQWYPNPFADQPILKIGSTGQLMQLARAWNAHPDVHFALHTFGYDTAGNLNAITFSHLDTQQQVKQSPFLEQIEHARYVRNPFVNNSAYGAAHFMVRGGLDLHFSAWLDMSRKISLSSTTALFSMSENDIAFRKHGNEAARYRYTYNANKLPVSMKKLSWNGLVTDSVRFTY